MMNEGEGEGKEGGGLPDLNVKVSQPMLDACLPCQK